MRKILIADVNSKVRQALRLVIEQEGTGRTAAEARDAIELIRLLSSHCADIALVDVEFPWMRQPQQTGGDSFAQIVAHIHSLCPEMKIIALSSQPTDENLSFSAGADGFICKSDPPDALLALIDQVGVTPPER